MPAVPTRRLPKEHRVCTSARTPLEREGAVGGVAVVIGVVAIGAVGVAEGVDSGVVPEVEVPTVRVVVGAGERVGCVVSRGGRVVGVGSRTSAVVRRVVETDRRVEETGERVPVISGVWLHPETIERKRNRQTAAALTCKA